MLKYNKDNEAYKLIEVLRIKDYLYARVEKLHTDEQKIVDYEEFENGNFSFAEEPKESVSFAEELPLIVPVNDNKPVTYKLEETVEIINKTIEATTPKGKKLTFDLADIEAFCNQYKLDVEAVKLVLEGVQKTHRKWGFVAID